MSQTPNEKRLFFLGEGGILGNKNHSAMSEKEIKRALEDMQNEIQALREEISRLQESYLPGFSELKGMLRRRGLNPYRQNPTQHLLFPPTFPPEKKEQFLHIFQKYSFRLFLREILGRHGNFRVGEVVRFSTPETGRNYLRFLMDLELAEPVARGKYRLLFLPTTSLGPTLEWFMAEVLRRTFFCPVLYGVRCKGTRYGGDYDVLAAVEGRLVYVEVKSSPPKNIESMEVREFLSRVQDLIPHLAFFFVDTELRLKDKIVPIFEAERLAQGRDDHLPVEKIGEEVFFASPGIYIFGSKHSIPKNMATCFRHHFTFSTDRRESGLSGGRAN